MFKKAFVQLNKFYDLDLNQNAHADEIFEVLNEIIKFDNAGIFYITASSLNLEYGKDFEIYENIKLDKNLKRGEGRHLTSEEESLLLGKWKNIFYLTT